MALRSHILATGWGEKHDESNALSDARGGDGPHRTDAPSRRERVGFRRRLSGRPWRLLGRLSGRPRGLLGRWLLPGLSRRLLGLRRGGRCHCRAGDRRHHRLRDCRGVAATGRGEISCPPAARTLRLRSWSTVCPTTIAATAAWMTGATGDRSPTRSRRLRASLPQAAVSAYGNTSCPPAARTLRLGHGRRCALLQLRPPRRG